MYQKSYSSGPSRGSGNSGPSRGGSDSRSGGGYSSRSQGGYSSRGPSSGGRPSYGSSSRSGGGGYSRGPSRFGGGGGGRRRGPMAEHIDVSRFINRAETVVEEVFTPNHTFKDFKLDAKLKANIETKGYVIPSPIQDQAIPYALDSRDIIGLANTGTGKTAAFLIPTINKLLKEKKGKAIIITPTRELALQIQRECMDLTKGLGIWNVTCVGGAPIRIQMMNLQRPYHIIIGTPGRLKDLLDRKRLVISDVSTVVLDEADRMLDMGFIDDVRYFLAQIPAERQMLLFSATMAPQIERLVADFLRTPVKISVKSRDTAKNVDQDVIRVPDKSKKLDILADLLRNPDFSKTLIFVETKRSVDRLHDELGSRGFRAASIHGDKRHNERQRALRGFSEGQIQILIATDVAARGLDISGVTHVINFEIPSSYDTYVHRIGRTGRANKKGIALTFV